MDRKSIVVLALSFILLMAWYPLMNRLYPPPVATNSLTRTVFTPSSTDTNSLSTNVGRAFVEPTLQASTSTFVPPQAAEELLVLEDKEARYTFTSHGGGLKQIELKDYPETIPCGTRTSAGTNRLATLNKQAPAPVMALLGSEMLQGDRIFQLRRTENGVQAEKTFTNGLRLLKEFHLGTNYLLAATIRFENHSAQPIQIPSRELVIGTATPTGTNANPNVLGLFWYDGNRAEKIGEPWFANRAISCMPGNPRTQYDSPGTNVVWAAVHNQFFTILVMPKEPARKVVSRRVPLVHADTPESAGARRGADPTGFQTALSYPESILTTNQPVEQHYEIFAGPKEYNTLARLGNNQDLVMDFGKFFGFFAKALLLAMNGLHAFGLPYGGAIIVITVIIKGTFWPLTQASTRSMKRMAALQPQMKALQEKYKDDPKKMNLKLMEFMKENKVSPLGGCLPMLLQIPVFFGFYQMLQSAIELRGARFLWACDLSQPDTLFIIPGLNVPFNLLPLIMGATQLWQAHMTPPSPGVDPMQQKIMKYMPLMFLVILYNFSAGLALYWTVQNLLTIAQMKLTKTTAGQPGLPAKKPVPPARASGDLKKKK
jgi:YidC/Oxa1 family membrane protein insertase